MSVENAKQFLNAMRDKNVQDAWKAKAADAKSDAKELDIAVDTARELGYDITAEDITAALEELKAERREKTQQAVEELQELDDNDLEDVAGGKVYYYAQTYKNGSEIRKYTEGCMKNMDDTFCFTQDACSSYVVFYYDCSEKNYKRGDEHKCNFDLWFS